MSIIYFLLAILLSSLNLPTNSILYSHTDWASKTLQSMTLDEKIGQLFMIAGYVENPEFAYHETKNPNIFEEINSYISLYNVGGIIFVGPSYIEKQVKLTQHYQQLSKYPLLIGQDLEWGLAMRVKDAINFPKNITLGSLPSTPENLKIIYEMGFEVARQAKLLGVHMNLSPVLDVNIEPENIVINVRSFGSDPHEVSEKGMAMIRGLQDGGIIASAKHFPGLGDISVDPHLNLPISNHSIKRLEKVEFVPFVNAIKSGVLSIQLDHILIPTLEQDVNVPSSLSYNVVTNILKKELGFSGLVLSGALRMTALTKYFSENEIVVRAFLAGSDILLMPQNLPLAFKAIKKAVEENRICEEDINSRVLKILLLKEKFILNKNNEENSDRVSESVVKRINSNEAKSLKKELYQRAVILTRDGNCFVSELRNKNQKIAYIQVSEGIVSSEEFALELQKNFLFDKFICDGNENAIHHQDLFNKLDQYDKIIVGIYPVDPRKIVEIRLMNEEKQESELKHFKVHGLTPRVINLLNKLKPYQKKILVSYFGNPWGLNFLDGFESLIMAYEPDPEAQIAAAGLLLINENNKFEAQHLVQ